MSGVISLVTCLARGGAQRVALETAARLHRPDRPHLLMVGGPGDLDAEAKSRLGRRFVQGPRFSRAIRPLDDALSLLLLHRALSHHVGRLGTGTIVHTHTSKAGILGRLAARAVPGAHLVHTVHGFGMPALSKLARPFAALSERVATGGDSTLVFVSDKDRIEARRLGLQPARTALVRAGVDEARTEGLSLPGAGRTQARARLRVPDEQLRVLTIGNLKPQKRPLFHVDILATLVARAPHAHLCLVGGGPLEAATREAARHRSVQAHLTLAGFVDDVRDHIAAADVFLLASGWEGLPCAVLEALSAGLPAVVSDVGYARELSFAGARLVALAPDAAAARYADAVVDASSQAPTPVALPRSFTLEGMLEALDALYDDVGQD